jgi:DNA repair protein RadC
MDIAHSTREHVVVFYFDGRGALVHREIISTGTHNTSRLVPKEIFHPIKAFPVDAIILAHNHPSGYLEASKEDILFTTRVRHAAEILGITLLDHLIITATGWKQIDKEINR